jgi:hypothetical protein
MRMDRNLRQAMLTLEQLRARTTTRAHSPLDKALSPEELHQLALLIRKIIETRAKLERLRERSELLRASLERFRARQASS